MAVPFCVSSSLSCTSTRTPPETAVGIADGMSLSATPPCSS
jgi:hypothetical protein